MGYDPAMEWRARTPAELRAHREALARQFAEHRRLFSSWYDHYRAFGLGHQRATEHARKRVARGKLPV